MKTYAVINNCKFPNYESMSIPDEAGEFLSDIIDSIETRLEEMESAVLACERGVNYSDNLAVVKRVIHTIKGEAGIIGMMDIYELCHQVEYLMDELPKEKMLDMLLSVKDWLDGAAKFLVHKSEAVEPQPAKTSRKKILIVEDDFTTRKLLQKYLADYGDCDVAVDGMEAVTAFKQALDVHLPYNLVCLDIIMPRMNGHETLKAFRDIEATHGIFGLDGVKVIMTTVLSDSKNIMGAFREGCEAYVIKPLNRQKLLCEIEKLCAV